MRPSFTLGIEEEYQTIDPETRDLRSHIKTEMLAKGKRRLEERVKAEMHQSVIEVGTRICRTISEARDDIYDLRRQMIHARRGERSGAGGGRLPIRSPIGAHRRSIPTSATSVSWKTCSRWPAPT